MKTEKNNKIIFTTNEDREAFKELFRYIEIFFAHKKMYNATRRD